MSLAKIQSLSLATKAVTTVLGIVQSILIVRFLTESEFGLVGLVIAVGSLIGVFQHMGIVDGAIRGIATLHDKKAIGKLFWIAIFLRQAITLPISIGLFFVAPLIAGNAYNHPEITVYIQLFALILILQAFQDVFGATLTGLKAFKELYTVQIITASVNIFVFGYLVWEFSMAGFFWAMIATTTLMVALFGIIILQKLRGSLNVPHLSDFSHYIKQVLSVGIFVYISRLIFVAWNRMPILVLGGVLATDQLGYLNMSLTFGARLTIVAMALSEVNLSWMSSLFVRNQEEFRHTVERNIQRLFILMLLITIPLNFFTPEIIRFIKPSYAPAEALMILMTTALFIYTLIDIGTSSIFVASNRSRIRTGIHLVMAIITGLPIAWLYVSDPHPLVATAAVLAGGLSAYALTVISANRLLKVKLLPVELFWFLFAFLVSIPWLLWQPSFIARIVVFIVFIAFIAWETYRKKFWPDWLIPIRAIPEARFRIICFAGASYTQPSWTNRQHMMSRISAEYPVLYIEPRRWIGRVLLHHWKNPQKLALFFLRLFIFEKKGAQLYIKSQVNLIPWSREVKLISNINHILNRWNITFWAWWLGFNHQPLALWLYDTEAVEYLSAYPQAKVVYDCVDDHAAQAGIDRNPIRAREEEQAIMARADLVTVTSKKLYELKKAHNKNVHLVLNAGDVHHVLSPENWPPSVLENKWKEISHPILGTVGALDSYKVDFELIDAVAEKRPNWQFVFIGSPVVDQKKDSLNRLRSRANVHFLGVVPHAAVPAEVQHFDVCLIPYRASTYNEASFPLKFWEFMATGKPVVVTGLPELKEYSDLIGYAVSSEDFISKVEAVLQQPNTQQEQRIALAGEHTWEKRVESLLHLVKQVL